MNVEEHSPKLKGTLNRTLEPADRETVERYFLTAVRNGGLAELDYKREEGQSFNPRPARILSILIEQANLHCPQTLSAAVLASVWTTLSADIRRELPPELVNLAEQAAGNSIPSNQAAIFIRLASYLDRARHLHLADSSKWDEIYGQCEAHIELAREHCAPLHTLLVSWKARFARNYLKRTK